MTTYEPPTQNLINFNSSVFKSANDVALTLAQAKSLFLGRTGNPTSTAISTTFTGGDLFIGGARFGLGKGGISSNIAVGNSSLNGITSGTSNVGVGTSTLVANTGGSRNVAVGFEAFKTGTIYNNSIALGANTVVAGNQAVAIGYLATASDSQIVLGTTAETVLCKGTTANGSLVASSDIFVNGIRAGKGVAVDVTESNTVFGKDALIQTSTARNNSAFGRDALKLNTGSVFTTGYANNAFGAFSLQAITTGFRNVGVGTFSLGNNGATSTLNTGNRNTACGSEAGFIFGGAASNNTYIGCHRDNSAFTTGSTNTLVGSQSILGAGTGTTNLTVNASTTLGAFTSLGGFSNSTAIGGGTSAAVPGAVCSANNQIMLGRTTEFVECAGTDATNGSLKLNGGLQLQTTYDTPTSTMLGYTIFAPLSSQITLDRTGVVGNLYSFTVPLGVWLILFQINLVSTNNLTITFMNQVLGLTSTSSNSYQLTGGQFVRNLTEVFANVDITTTPGTSVCCNFTAPFTLYLNMNTKYTGAGDLTATASYNLTRIG